MWCGGLLVLSVLVGPTPPIVVYGRVLEEGSDRPLARSVVSLPELPASIESDSLGHFRLTAESPGWHLLRVTRLGYDARSIMILLPSRDSLRVDVRLRAKPLPLVSVEALTTDEARRLDGRILKPEVPAAWDGEVLRGEDAWLVGTGADADYLAALAASPDVATNPLSPGALRVRGGAPDQTLIRLDGFPLYAPYHSSTSLTAVTGDALEGARLQGAVPSAQDGGVLSGFVDLYTRRTYSTPWRIRGGLSPTSVRTTILTPVGSSSLLLSGRVLRGGGLLTGGAENGRSSSDFLVRVRSPLGGGEVEALAYRTTDRSRFPARVDAGSQVGESGWQGTGDATGQPRFAPESSNAFDSRAETFGIAWSQPLSHGLGLRARAWRADVETAGAWRPPGRDLNVAGGRSSTGLDAAAVYRAGKLHVRVGTETVLESARAVVENAPGSAVRATSPGRIAADRTFTRESLYGEGAVRGAGASGLRLGVRAILEPGGRVGVAPRVLGALEIEPGLVLTAGYGRTYQDVQSLWNPESLVAGMVSGALPVAPGTPAMRPAHADQLVASLTLALSTKLGLRAGGYLRSLHDLLLVAPVEANAFALDPRNLHYGRGRAQGLDLDLTFRDRRLRLRASYGRMWVTRSLGYSLAYEPAGTPRQTLSLAAGWKGPAGLLAQARFVSEEGRRTTPVVTRFQWERCSVLSTGCVMAGTPVSWLPGLDSMTLPRFARIELGVGKDWVVRVAGRPSTMSTYVRIASLLGNSDLLGYSLVAGQANPLPARVPSRFGATVGLVLTF